MRNEEKIQEIIKDYFESNTLDSALMINGDWGSGKTYFAKNSVIPYIENTHGKECIYISLNGISSTNNIAKEILFQSMVEKTKNTNWLPKSRRYKNEKSNWLSKLQSYGTEVSKVFLDHLSISDDSVNYFNLIDIENSFLVFDDLERAKIDVAEVLGYINTFVEHKNICTIILANEKEINEDEYSRIKEKVISKTFYYEPDIKKCIDQFLLKYPFCETEKEVLDINKNNIAFIFITENYNNLRTMQFILSNFLKLCETLRKFPFQHNEQKQILEILFNYLVRLSIESKKSNQIELFPEDKEFAVRKLSLPDNATSDPIFSSDALMGFAFVDELVLYSFLDKDRIDFAITKYLHKQRQNHLSDNDPANMLFYWWEKNDKDVEISIKKVEENLSLNLYPLNLYPKILSYLMVLNRIGFQINLDSIKDNMKQNINNANNDNLTKFDLFGTSPDFKDENDKNDFIDFFNILNTKIDDNKSAVFKDKINNIFSSTETWSEDFEAYVSEHKNEFFNRKKFISLIDVPSFCRAIKHAENHEIINIRKALDLVYNINNISDYFMADIESIQKIIERLTIIQVQNIFGIIKNNHITFLINQLIGYKEKLSNENHIAS